MIRYVRNCKKLQEKAGALISEDLQVFGRTCFSAETLVLTDRIIVPPNNKFGRKYFFFFTSAGKKAPVENTKFIFMKNMNYTFSHFLNHSYYTNTL